MQDNKNAIIIAEAGVNHNGDIIKAKELIDAAAEAGVDYVKFQTFKADKIVSKTAKKAKYQQENTRDSEETQYAMLKKLELSDADHQLLIQYCFQRGVKFLSSAFDLESLDYLNDLGIDLFKIPSGELTNYPYLNRLSEIGKPVIVSTGLANIKELNQALDVLTQHSLTKEDITVLHCNTAYPTPMTDVNLKAMKTIQKECEIAIGFSDHTLGIEIPIAAVALGATVIEKHFTLDKNMEGPDHLASLEPAELKAMVDGIRNVEKALSGNGIKEPSPSELKNMAVARKSIMAKKEISAGQKFTEENLTVKRPGNGISPMKWSKILGKEAKSSYNVDDLIDEKELEG